MCEPAAALEDKTHVAARLFPLPMASILNFPATTCRRATATAVARLTGRSFFAAKSNRRYRQRSAAHASYCTCVGVLISQRSTKLVKLSLTLAISVRPSVRSRSSTSSSVRGRGAHAARTGGDHGLAVLCRKGFSDQVVRACCAARRPHTAKDGG